MNDFKSIRYYKKLLDSDITAYQIEKEQGLVERK